MRNSTLIFGLLVILLGINSCEEPSIQPGFEDMEQMTILDFIMENQEDYSSFYQVLQAGGIDKTLSAYNPDGLGYTLFLPDNKAMDEFIAQHDQYNTLEELLNDQPYSRALCRYHVVNMAIETNDFPFGALPEYTLSEDFLTVNFVIETDTSYYKINNEAPIAVPNIEVSNGFIHGISKTLTPITFTSYDWLKQHAGFSIFIEAAELTGLQDTLDFNLKAQEIQEGAFTVLVEPDSVYNRKGIYTLDDLIQEISPEDSDYTNKTNPLYNYVAYHI
ncbi:MAG: fasciclin domain-containing protein, partial [Bacteroidales bacterium]